MAESSAASPAPARPAPEERSAPGRHPWLWRTAPVAAGLLALFTALPHAQAVWSRRGARPSWESGDLDAYLIHAGLERAPAFADTLRWWTGPWVMGEDYAFYRPLTSLVFWVQWRLFGDREWLWALPTLAAHAVATGLFALFITRIAERRGIPAQPAALWAALGFAGVLAESRWAVCALVIGLWKNQPDSLAAICVFMSALAYLRAQEGRRGSLAASAAWLLAACGFKEVAVPLPLALAALEWEARRGARRGAAARLAAMAGTVLAFLIIRQLALGGPGYTYGANVHWLNRTLLELAGPFGVWIVHGEWLGCSLGAWTFAAGFAIWRVLGGAARAGRLACDGRAWGMAGGVLATWVAGCGLLGAAETARTAAGSPGSGLEGFDPLAGLALCGDPTIRSTAAAAAGLLLAVLVLWPRHKPVLALACLWNLGFLLPLAASPGPLHRYYLSQAGLYIAYGLAAALAAGRAWQAVLRLRARIPRRAHAPAEPEPRAG